MSNFIVKLTGKSRQQNCVKVRKSRRLLSFLFGNHRNCDKLGIWSTLIKNIWRCGLKLFMEFHKVLETTNTKKVWNSDLFYGEGTFYLEEPILDKSGMCHYVWNGVATKKCCFFLTAQKHFETQVGWSELTQVYDQNSWTQKSEWQ